MKKKIFLIFILIIMMPINVFAYSNYIIPGGENIGIKIESNGVLVIGFYKVLNQYNNNGIEIGDYITKINENPINSVNDLVNIIEENKDNKTVLMEIRRNGKIKKINFELKEIDGVIKTGLYVKDSITGIGTLTYIDPATNIYGALGHEVIESQTKAKLEINQGTIFKSEVTSIDRSINGVPGTKNAKFTSSKVFGSVLKNTNKGIYGRYNDIPEKELMEVGNPKTLHTGDATIYTVLNKNEIKEYKIKITNIDYNNKIKNIYFEINDEELLEKTGGIIQGMSGSPIIQDNKIYGAVTHVVIDNVKRGYGIFITTMLEEGEKK